MNIGVVGLGLIGGSIAKAIKQNTSHVVYGADIKPSVVMQAKTFEVIDEELTKELLSQCDVTVIALYPCDAAEYIRQTASCFKKGGIVVDCCGIKRFVCDAAEPLAEENGFTFIGGHPMAGIEKWGFESSQESLFRNASMILTPFATVDIRQLNEMKQLFLSIGFGSIKISTPQEHDRIIAYTSQLAHVLSNAYIKSEAALSHQGFSAGSFRDMTRVATLLETMWTELFFLNKDNLIAEIDELTAHLNQYKEALKNDDEERMMCLLREGRERKALINQKDKTV
ncbi:MAG: prephenate dehydrogenase [Christensenellales bacterium]